MLISVFVSVTALLISFQICPEHPWLCYFTILVFNLFGYAESCYNRIATLKKDLEKQIKGEKTSDNS